MEEKTMSINELIARIHEAQALAFQQHIQANAIIINENFVKVPEKMIGNSIWPPMICGLEMRFTKAELPDNTMFAVCEVMETEREKAIRQTKRDLCNEIADYINEKLVDIYGAKWEIAKELLNIDEFFDKLNDLSKE